MSDRLALTIAIEDAGIARDKAQNLASVIINIVTDTAATKADVRASQAELMAVIAKLDAKVERLDGKVDLIMPHLLIRLSAVTVAVGGILFTALHYWPPHQ